MTGFSAPRAGRAAAVLGSLGAFASLAAFAALALAGVSTRAAAQGAEAPPTPMAPRPLQIAAPVEQQLPNGLRVVLAQRPGVQLVTAKLVVLTGAEADPPDLPGLASMTAGLLSKGTRSRSATQLAHAAESLGGALDSSAGWRQSDVSITVTAPLLDAALTLVGDVVRRPVFAPAELDRLRAQVLDGLKVGYSQPGTLAALAMRRLLYGDGPYGHPPEGTRNSLPRITRARLQALHAAHYRPDNAVLVLAGDLDAEAARALALKHFGAWRAPRTAAAAPSLAANRALPQTAVLVDLPQSGQAAVVVAMPLPTPGADRATATVMNAVLGGGYSSRLNQEIRVRRGLSYGAGSSLDLRPGGAALRVVVQTMNVSAAEVVALVQTELDRLAAPPVGDDELSARKATLIGSVGRSIETTAGLAGAIEALVVAGRPVAELRTRIEALSAVSAADVQRYAVAHLGASGRRVAVAGEAARIAEGLKAAAPGAAVVPAARFDQDAGAAALGTPPAR